MDHPLHNVGIAEKSCLKEPGSASNTRCPPGCLLWCSPVREQFAVPYNEDTLLHLQVSFHHKYFMSLSLLYPTIHRSACISWQRPRFPHRSMGIALLLRLPFWAFHLFLSSQNWVHSPWLQWRLTYGIQRTWSLYWIAPLGEAFALPSQSKQAAEKPHVDDMIIYHWH